MLSSWRGHFDQAKVRPTTAKTFALVIWMTIVAAVTANAQGFGVVYSFMGGLDGANPTAALAIDRSGDFYGTTSSGYVNSGTVFKLTRAASGWVINPLYGFQGGLDGASPYASVTIGPDGNLYGTTAAGGLGYGTVFELSPPSTPCKTAICPWIETVLYRFSGGGDGAKPLSNVTFDQVGNLYGTTQLGGFSGCYAGNTCGLVYKLTPQHGLWAESVIHSFTGGADGEFPIAGVIFDQAGNLYGTAEEGGTFGTGTVFELTPSGSGWAEKTLYSFQGGSDGGDPWAGLIFDAAGNLYGASSAWGNGLGGTVFELSPSNGSWTFTLIYTFDGGSGGPRNSLVMDNGGNLFGAAFVINGGLGTAFELTPSAGGWSYTDLHDFTGGSDGGYAWGGVTLDTHGNVYGTTLDGGVYGRGCYGGCGVVYAIAP